MLKNAYLLAKICADEAVNEWILPKFWQNSHPAPLSRSTIVLGVNEDQCTGMVHWWFGVRVTSGNFSCSPAAKQEEEGGGGPEKAENPSKESWTKPGPFAPEAPVPAARARDCTRVPALLRATSASPGSASANGQLNHLSKRSCNC